ncbi:MAG: hypothetical protein J0I07_37525, partial [Myxococcales bacterium]|nr:hypothetical protein [Myxococcales bacterium]
RQRRPAGPARGGDGVSPIDQVEIAVSYVDGGAATQLLANLPIGGLIDASGPYGRFSLQANDANRRYLLVATGTGVTPYRAMLPQMEKLASDAQQSCHLAVLSGARVLIVAQVDAPRAMHYAVRLGAQFPLAETSSGAVLFAYQPEHHRQALLDASMASFPELAETLPERADKVLVEGGERRESLVVSGVTNLSQPVFDHRGVIAACLTIPFLVQRGLAVDIEDNAAWRDAMSAHDFVWLGASDPVHFDFKGGGVTDIGGLSVLAFQRLWNRNHPEDRIEEDSEYGPATEERLAKAPVGGFAKGADCSQPKPTNPPATSSGGGGGSSGFLGSSGERVDGEGQGCAASPGPVTQSGSPSTWLALAGVAALAWSRRAAQGSARLRKKSATSAKRRRR